jgi:molecular chaperone GrpE (heat shock protein)
MALGWLAQRFAPPSPDTRAIEAAARAGAERALAESDLAEQLRKAMRGLARASAEIAQIRSALDALAAAPANDPTPLLDAIDDLERAADAIGEGHVDGASEGLRRVSERLGGMVARQGLRRVGTKGEPIDGKLFRVVGAEGSPFAAGAIARVVRAAVVRGGDLVRMGDVIASRKDGMG